MDVLRRTSAMKRGSALHQTLEEEIHKTVAIDITTTENALVMRMWNMIQGLRTLRHTGMTREFEIWGVVDSLLVIGVIDEISFTCPDEELEAEGLPSTGSLNMEATENPATGQALTTNYVGSHRIHSEGKSSRGARVQPKKVYLTDIKMRRARDLPNGTSTRQII